MTSTLPSNPNGILVFPQTNSSLETAIVGEVKNKIATSTIAARIATGNANAGFKGNIMAKTVRKRSTGKAKFRALGKTRSRYLNTLLDYALSMTEQVPVLIISDPELKPVYAQPGDAGCDLRASEATIVPARGRVLVKTGISIALPDGYVGLVHPRSGLAAKHGITVLNTPGTIDAGYRGEVMVTLYNTTDQDFPVARLDRIAQLVVQQYVQAKFVEVDKLPESHRGEAGFGSTGVK